MTNGFDYDWLIVGSGFGGSVSANRVFDYQNLLVCDGAAMPANPGVNPSLTITAITENAMSHIPPAAERNARSGSQTR